MQDPLGTTVVFEDLRKAYEDLTSSRRFPLKFRRAFDEYVYRSQQLTEVMRREYSRYTATAWDAASFSGWNAFTRTLKALRRETYHGTPLVLYETTLSVYPAIRFVTDREPIGPRQAAAGIRLMEGTLLVERPFSEKIITPGVGFPKEDGTYAIPTKEFVSYKLRSHSFDVSTQKCLEQAGTTDAVLIALRSFPVLRVYFSHYEAALRANTLISL
jgi:hypothetical protein